MDRYYKHLAISGLISFGGLALILLLQTIPFISNIMTAIFFAGSVGAVINNYYRLARLHDSGAIAHISQRVARPAVVNWGRPSSFRFVSAHNVYRRTRDRLKTSGLPEVIFLHPV